MYAIVAKTSASKEFDQLPSSVQAQFRRAFESLQRDPFQPRPGVDVKRLQGLRPGWRLRVGRYRGIYQVEGMTVRFVRFGHRSTVYR